MQDFLRMYANLAEKCFNTCCNDFTSKALSSKEVILSLSYSTRVLNFPNLFFGKTGNVRLELYRKVHKAL